MEDISCEGLVELSFIHVHSVLYAKICLQAKFNYADQYFQALLEVWFSANAEEVGRPHKQHQVSDHRPVQGCGQLHVQLHG